jgi:hypothetical protein
VEGFDGVGRLLIVGGLVLAGLGVVLVLAPNVPFLGRLPGDIRIDRDNVHVFIPLGTMLLVSIVLTVLLNLIGRGR